MTTATPSPGNAPGLADTVSAQARESALAPKAVRARIAAFCEHFAVVPPGKLKTIKGKVYLSKELMKWCEDNGASMDWILIGKPMAALAAYREKHLRETGVIKAVRKLDDEEADILTAALHEAQAKIEAKRARQSATA